MKVGTDGVLLGAWADVKNASDILDIGTGTGLIALMCAQRSNANIHAIEIEMEAAQQAHFNCSASPWKERITVFNESLQHFAANHNLKYDLIVTNPPYFRNSLKPANHARSSARHDERLSYEILLFYMPRLLTKTGKLAVILPAAEIIRFTDLAFMEGLFPLRKLLVKPSPGKPFSRCLTEFTLQKDALTITEEMAIKNENAPDFTEAFIKLTKEFYLKF
jgi:tRNA1Val (adenine37-N6)-methyltransferase